MFKLLAASALVAVGLNGCEPVAQSSDSIQKQQQERLSKEAVSQVGIPAVKNFREMKLLKDIIEMRDQEGLVTYTYAWSEY